WRNCWRRKRRRADGAVCETWAPGRDRRRFPRPLGTPWGEYRTRDRRPPRIPPPLPARAANWWRCAAGSRPDETCRRAQDRDRRAAGQSVSAAWFRTNFSVTAVKPPRGRRPFVHTRRILESPMRTAIVHYWLLNRRGGENVVDALCRLLPGADIYTLFCDPATLSPEMRAHHITTSFLNPLRRYYRSLL